MKFEIISFLGAFTLYLVRLRIRHNNEGYPTYPSGFVDETFIPTMSAGHPQPDSYLSDEANKGSPDTIST